MIITWRDGMRRLLFSGLRIFATDLADNGVERRRE
jgi:hypothetical protein